MVSAASVDLCSLILVINEQFVFPRVCVTQVNCNFIKEKKGTNCGVSCGNRNPTGTLCIESLLLLSCYANKHMEVSFMN